MFIHLRVEGSLDILINVHSIVSIRRGLNGISCHILTVGGVEYSPIESFNTVHFLVVKLCIPQ